MKFKCEGIRVFAALVALSSAQAQAQNPQFQWFDAETAASGIGCQQSPGTGGDVAVIANGGDLSIIFSNMGISHPAGVSGPLSESKKCNFRVPFLLGSRVRPLSLTETLSYGLVKTESASINVAYRSSVDGAGALTPHGVQFSYGAAYNEPIGVSTFNQDFTSGPLSNRFQIHCSSGLASRMMYRGDLSIAASRVNTYQDLIFSLDTLDLRMDIKAGGISSCYTIPTPPTPRPSPGCVDPQGRLFPVGGSYCVGTTQQRCTATGWATETNSTQCGYVPPSGQCAGGYTYFGVCHRLGAFGQSCADVCRNFGGPTNSQPSTSSNPSCGHVIRNLDRQTPRGSDNSYSYPCGGPGSDYGCFILNDNNAYLCRNFGFGFNDKDPRLKRVCGCAM